MLLIFFFLKSEADTSGNLTLLQSSDSSDYCAGTTNFIYPVLAINITQNDIQKMLHIQFYIHVVKSFFKENIQRRQQRKL